MVFFGITCMVFCYKFRTFAEFWYFFLAKCRGRLIHRYSRTCNFLAKKQGVDLYTGSTYIPENTVHTVNEHSKIKKIKTHSTNIMFKLLKFCSSL